MKRKKSGNIIDKVVDFFANLKNEFLLLSTPQKVAVSAVAGILFITIVGGIIIIAMFSGSDEPDDNSDSTSVSGVTQQDDDYDPDEFEIDAEDNEFVLSETEDAGEDYLLNSMFIGDSNTIGFEQFLPLENVIGVESMGIQSLASERAVYYEGSDTGQTIPYAVAAQQPQRVFITMGTNNLVGVSTEQFIANYEKAVDAILESWEYCDIIIVTIPPLAQSTSNPNLSQKTVDQFNLGLLEMVERRGWKLLNTTSLLKGDDGYIKAQYITSDGIHLTSDAHNAILDFASTHALESDDRRPQPLAAQPERKQPPDVPDTSSSSSSSSSSSQNLGAASQGEIEKLKLAVTNGKKKLAEAFSSTTGDGSDLTAGDVASGWVPKAIYDALSATIAKGESLIAATEPSAAEVITAEASINSAITNFSNSIKTVVDKSDVQIAREALVASLTTAKTTLASAVANDDPSLVPVGTQCVPLAIWNTLQSAIANGDAVNGDSASTVDNLETAKTLVDSNVVTFTSNIKPGTLDQALDNAIINLNSAITTANNAKSGITQADTAPTTVGTKWTTTAAFTALNNAITAAEAARSLTSATDISAATATLNSAVATFSSTVQTVVATSTPAPSTP